MSTDGIAKNWLLAFYLDSCIIRNANRCAQIDVRKFFGIFETFNAKTDIFIARCCCCCHCHSHNFVVSTVKMHQSPSSASQWTRPQLAELTPDSPGARVKRELWQCVQRSPLKKRVKASDKAGPWHGPCCCCCWGLCMWIIAAKRQIENKNKNQNF